MSISNHVMTKDGNSTHPLRVRLQQIIKEGTNQQLIDCYNENAEQYNEVLESMHFEPGWRAFAETVAQLQPNKNARILDCAAGTGLAGKQLYDIGYRNIDALEPSERLLEIARSLDIYTNCIVDSVIPDKRSSIKDATYDTIFICGAVLKGHITLDCLPEIIRMLKKGGTLIFNISDTYWKTDPNFEDDALKRRFEAYVDDGKMVKWHVKRAPYAKDEECYIYSIFV